MFKDRTEPDNRNLVRHCDWTKLLTHSLLTLQGENTITSRSTQANPLDAVECDDIMNIAIAMHVQAFQMCKTTLTALEFPFLSSDLLQKIFATFGLFVVFLCGPYRNNVCSLTIPSDARGVVIDPEKYTVHDVTGTLKQFLHSLPDPVLTQGLYQNFIATIRKWVCSCCQRSQ